MGYIAAMLESLQITLSLSSFSLSQGHSGCRLLFSKQNLKRENVMRVSFWQHCLLNDYYGAVYTTMN